MKVRGESSFRNRVASSTHFRQSGTHPCKERRDEAPTILVRSARSEAWAICHSPHEFSLSKTRDFAAQHGDGCFGEREHRLC
jgi:hypothetical protein